MIRLKSVSCATTLLVLLASSRVWAQDTTAATTTATGSTSSIPNLPGFLLPNQQQIATLKKACAACKEKFCKCCVGQLISGMTMPLTMMSGGCIKPCCPPVSQEALKAPADSAAGACARITKDQMEMEERRKAVRCLARVDCNWYPEAELALINSLRTDKAECVRLEAAKVLSIGCCGTKRVIEALTITVNASTKDGNPPENSPRVREMALVALQHALECYVEREEPQRPETPGPGSLPAPKPLPEKSGPEKPAADKTALLEKKLKNEEPSDVVTAALETLKNRGAITQAQVQVPDEGIAGKSGGEKGQESRVAQQGNGNAGGKGWGNQPEPSEAVLSRAMLAIRKNRESLATANRPPHQALARGERSVMGILRHAMQGNKGGEMVDGALPS